MDSRNTGWDMIYFKYKIQHALYPLDFQPTSAEGNGIIRNYQYPENHPRDRTSKQANCVGMTSC